MRVELDVRHPQPEVVASSPEPSFPPLASGGPAGAWHRPSMPMPSAQAEPFATTASAGHASVNPSHCSARSHTDTDERHSELGGAGVQTPSALAPRARLQTAQRATESPPHIVSQQTPSTQDAVRHAALVVHVSPVAKEWRNVYASPGLSSRPGAPTTRVSSHAARDDPKNAGVGLGSLATSSSDRLHVGPLGVNAKTLPR